MNKSDFYSGQFVTHNMLGLCNIDDSCIYLNAINSDPTSCFVVHDGETKEVTLALIRPQVEISTLHTAFLCRLS